jgi:hypothetical protein
LAVITPETQLKFAEGRNFEKTFKATFSNSIDVSKQLGSKIDQYSILTQQLLNNNSEITLFEAGFIHDEVLVLTDVLQKNKDNSYTIYEIKYSTELTDVIIQDIAIQYYVCSRILKNIKSVNIVLNDGWDGFNIIDVTDSLKKYDNKFIEQNIEDFKEIINSGIEPQITVGGHCERPYNCEYKDYCYGRKSQQIKKSDFDITDLDTENEEFKHAAELVEYTNKSVYLTGKAGTGKTTFLKYIRNITRKKLVVLAPTGVAAINAGGQTIHSFFKITPSVYIPYPHDKRLRVKPSSDDTDKSTIYDLVHYNKEKLKIIRNMELLIIDEVSMVRCDLLDLVDRILRVFRRKENIAFGGVQVVLIGDTFQLPPVVKNDEWSIMEQYYKSPFFFSAEVMKENPLIYIELKKIYRQNEQDFIDLLNRVRTSQITQGDIDVLNSKLDCSFTPSKTDNYITLATTNRIVEDANVSKLAELDSELKCYEAEVKDVFPENIMPTDRLLSLKEGAQVMFIKNDKDKRYFNGKIGKVAKLNAQEIFVEIENEGISNTIMVQPQIWENVKYSWNEEKKKIEEEIIGSFLQFPIKLAWAITVHKSQGLTFEKVIADIGSSFASGQVYVALSRCTSFNGIVLKSRINRSAIKTDRRVLDFAEEETPNTLIVQELKTGKADFYYQNAREFLKQHNIEECYNAFTQALKYRNDIETEIFKRFFITTASRMISYKQKFIDILEQIGEQIGKIDKLNEHIQEQIKKTEKLTSENNEFKHLISSQEKQIIKIDKERKLLKMYSNSLQKEATQKDKEIKTLEKRIINMEEEIEELRTIIEENHRDIERLNNLKWYQRIMI